MNEEFEHPRLAAAYDALDPDRSDLAPYLAYARQLQARHVVDLGCGTGTLALLLVERGLTVTGVDPATASLGVARAKPGAHAVRWIRGDASTLIEARLHGCDLVTMTANVAMFLQQDAEFTAALRSIATVLRPGGHLMFETRNPAARAWERWTREQTWHEAELPGQARVESWVEVTAVRWPFVDICNWFVFSDGTTLTSNATLRYRDSENLRVGLDAAGFDTAEIRDAPDRPGREWILLVRRR